MTNEPILSSLQQQLACYQDLAKLAKIQHEHVQNSRTEDLLMVLSQRQALLDRVASLEQTLGPAKKRWSDYVADLPDKDRPIAQAMLDETRQLLEEITSSDRDDALVLQQRKFNLGKEINSATAARKFNRNYAAAAYGQVRKTLDLQR